MFYVEGFNSSKCYITTTNAIQEFVCKRPATKLIFVQCNILLGTFRRDRGGGHVIQAVTGTRTELAEC